MKRALLIGIPLLLVIGIVLGVATIGIVKIPGITPKSYGRPMIASPSPVPGFIWTVTRPLQSLADQSDALKKQVAAAPPPASVSPVGKPDPALGEAKLASLWNGLEADQLAKVTEKWEKVSLCRILLKMDPDQVSAFLGSLDPKRAAELSQEIKVLASTPPASVEQS